MVGRALSSVIVPLSSDRNVIVEPGSPFAASIASRRVQVVLVSTVQSVAPLVSAVVPTVSVAA